MDIKPKHEIKLTEDGLHLSNSLLWMDSYTHGSLSFLSSASILSKAPKAQTIATEETIKILESMNKQLNTLICQYNRPFSIGALNLELIPSGYSIGSASLYIESQGENYLYVPCLQTDKNDLLRKAQFKSADNLIIKANHPGHSVGRKKTNQAIVQYILSLVEKEIFPVVYCDLLSVAPFLTSLLSSKGIPVTVHRNIYKVNKIYELYGNKMGSYQSLSDKNVKKVVILPATQLGKKDQVFKDRYKVIVGQDFSYRYDFEPSSQYRYYISNSFADINATKEYIRQVSPKRLYVYGPYSKRYIKELKGYEGLVQELYPNNQPSLF